ncbi:hypothetical protein [Agromyces bauzanensis]
MHREESTKHDSRFATETELAPPVEAWLEGIGSSCIGREVEVGFGVPDLVAGVGSRTSLRNRRRQARPVTQSLHLAVLDFCRTPRSETELREWAPNGYSELNRRALKPLLGRGMLVFRNEKLRARVAPKDPFERIIAVELKLADAKRGLAQAHAYRAFADVSYLALPARRITPELMERARAIGVGLLAVHTGLVEEIVEPDADSYATAGRRRMASEHTMAAHADAALRSAGAPRRR